MTCRNIYPFVAIVGQDKMKQALYLNLVNPTLSGVLIRGEKGTAKSTAVRALADILPKIQVIKDCPFQLAPEDGVDVCRECFRLECREKRLGGEKVESMFRHIRVVELPVGATEDRVVGTLDLEHAIRRGQKRVEPGLLAAAHRGILYVDEVNLLDDHVVDVLLDAAAMGVNTIEREGISFSHPARFVLVGTMNPEEGELRPQLLDRFGLSVFVQGMADRNERVEVMERRAAFDEDPEGFAVRWSEESRRLAERIERARALYPRVSIDRQQLFAIADLCLEVGVDGHRADIITLKAAKALAALDGLDKVEERHVEAAAELALPHRVRRRPLMDMDDEAARVRALARKAP
ncbi:MAG: ATP-binding protein [Desulfacinum sp.]|jgi:magnesium chelatase subunit I|nr:ATP-binding protein [Desulfacinum sp.]MBZ4658080.1 magnesium chelatase [Desulfacinum sp.]